MNSINSLMSNNDFKCNLELYNIFINFNNILNERSNIKQKKKCIVLLLYK